MGFDFSFAVDREGRGGGLAILWRQVVNCQLMNYSANYINMEMVHATKGKWRLTCFYGLPDRSRRREFWAMIRNLASMLNLPWCIIDDCNDMLLAEDKKGRVPYPNWLLNGFREVVNDSNLVDLPLEGYPYTWSRESGLC